MEKNENMLFMKSHIILYHPTLCCLITLMNNKLIKLLNIKELIKKNITEY